MFPVMETSPSETVLVFPAEGLRDLLGEGEGIEGLEEYPCDTEVGEAALVDSLDLGGEEDDGDVRDGGILLHEAEGGGAIDFGHHDVHDDGVGVFASGDQHTFFTGAGGDDVPAGDGFE